MADSDSTEIERAIAECEENGGTELSLWGVSCGADDDDPEVLDKVLSEAFQSLPNLAKLSIVLCFEAKSLGILTKQVRSHSGLRALDLLVGGDEALIALAQQSTLLPLVQYLCLEGVGDDGLKALAAQAEHLTRLQQLDFDECDFGDEGLGALAVSAKHLVSLEKFFEGDTQSLNVTAQGCKSLTEFAALKQLVLAGWPIDDDGLSAIARRGKFAASLEELDLRFTDVGDDGVNALVEHAERFARLEWLNLYGLDVGDDALQAMVLGWQRRAFRTLRRVNFLNTSVQLVAREVLETEDAVQIFEAALVGLAMPEAKIVVLGEPGVGKTSLCRRLLHDKLADPAKRRETHDFELIRPQRRPRVRDQDVQLRVWDFGGQHVLHGTHEMFLTSRSVCLLVLDGTQVEEHDPQVQDEERDGNRLSYWLKMIRHFMGTDAHVILVVTKSDDPDACLPSLDVDRLRIDHHFTAPIQLVEGFSAALKQCAQPAKDLWQVIEDTLEQMDELHSRVSRKFVALKERVEREMEGRALASLDEYRDWCREVRVRKSHDQDVYLRTLHHFGSVFCFGRLDFEKEKLQQSRSRKRSDTDDLPPGQRRWLKKEPQPALQRWLVNPHWLKRPLYELIRESKGQPWLDEGTIRRTARRKPAKLTIDNSTAAGDVVLAVLKLTELCFYDSERGKYFFPRGLPNDSRPFLTGWDQANRHERIWKWDFFPESVIHRFIVKSHEDRDIRVEAQWRTGTVLQHDDTQVAVQSEPEDGKVTLWLKKRPDNASRPSRQDEEFMETLRKHLVDLTGCKPHEPVWRSWQEDTACATDASFGKDSAPQESDPSPDTAANTSLDSAGKLSKYAETAYQAYEMAAEALGEPTDKKAYAWIKEHDPTEYDLPAFETWCKYLRMARKHYGTSKHSPRAGRSGRSVARPDEI